MSYKGKVDWWIGLSIAAGLAVEITVGIAAKSAPMYLLFAATAILVFGFAYPKTYITGDRYLLVKAGLRTIRIPYSQIVSAGPSSDSRSSLALSLDRVLIEYGSTAVMIAPKDRTAFLADVAAHAPQLSRHGQNLVISLT